MVANIPTGPPPPWCPLCRCPIRKVGMIGTYIPDDRKSNSVIVYLLCTECSDRLCKASPTRQRKLTSRIDRAIEAFSQGVAK